MLSGVSDEEVEGVCICDACPAPINVLSTAVSRDGDWLILSSGGSTVRCWPARADAPEGEPLVHQRNLDEARALALAPFPGGDLVLARTGRGELWRWDRTTGQPTGPPVDLDAPRARISIPPLAVIETAGGPLAVASARGGGLRRWDPVTGVAAGSGFGLDAGPVTALASAVMPDGAMIVVAGGADRLLRRWDPLTGAELGAMIAGCGQAVVIAATRLGDGRSVVCVLDAEGVLHRRDLVTGEPAGELIRTGWEPGRFARVCTGLMAVVAAGGQAFAVTCVDYCSVWLWDLVAGVSAGCLVQSSPAITGLAGAQLPDGTPLVVVGDRDGNVRRFDPRNRAQVGGALHPHGLSAALVQPVEVPDGRIILAVADGSSVRRFDARTGQAIGDPMQPWRISCNALASAAVADGRTILVAADEDGIARQEVVSGTEYPPSGDEQPFTIWDVATVTLPGGRVLIAGAGHDWLVYRWDAATGEAVGEPLEGHPISVKAITTATRADGTPMLVTGCERGLVLRWDAATGARIGEPLSGAIDEVRELAAVSLPDGTQILAGLDADSLHMWDPVSGRPLGQPAVIGTLAQIVATHVDAGGIPTAFLLILDDNHDPERLERWRLDSGTRVDDILPVTLRAVFDDRGITWMVLGQDDGSLMITRLPGVLS